MQAAYAPCLQSDGSIISPLFQKYNPLDAFFKLFLANSGTFSRFLYCFNHIFLKTKPWGFHPQTLTKDFIPCPAFAPRSFTPPLAVNSFCAGSKEPQNFFLRFFSLFS